MSDGSAKQRAGAAYFVLLALSGVAAGLFIPAASTGARFVHALLVIVAGGVLAVALLLLAMFGAAFREARNRKRTP